MSRNAIIYARFSSTEQSKGYSLERQRTRALQFATESGWSVEKTITDEGRSAFHGTNRLEGSALHEFELEARNGLHRGKVLLIENVDRLSRQGAKAAAQLIWTLNEQGVDVATWQDGYVYQASNNGDLMELFSVIIKAQMAFEESDKKSKRTKATWEKRFEQIADGTYNGPIPNTPRWIDNTERGFVLNPERTAVLNLIFDLYIDGIGIHRIVTILHERKVASWTPPEQRRGNNGWFYSYIYRLLTKRSVLGEYVTSDGNRSVAPIGTTVIIPLAMAATATGQVVWCRGKERGVEFHTPIPSISIDSLAAALPCEPNEMRGIQCIAPDRENITYARDAGVILDG